MLWRVAVFLMIATPLFGQEENEILKVKALRDRFDQMLEVKVYPNPAVGGFVYIDSPSPVSYELFDLSGASLRRDDGVSVIDIGDLPKGSYIISIWMEGMEKREKLVIL